MAAYAPLLAKEGASQWEPDLIRFNNTGVYGTPSYYVQKMFSENRGQKVLPSRLVQPEKEQGNIRGAIGLGTWSTQVQYKDVKVTGTDGKQLFYDDFSDDSKRWSVVNGKWAVKNQALQQTGNDINCYTIAGDKEWTDYTLTLKAKKTGGSEGMLILFGAKDKSNN